MKIYFILIICILSSNLVMGQNIFKMLVRNNNTNEILKGATATISDLKILVKADTNGIITINNIPNGKFEIEITYLGYAKSKKVYTFPRPEYIVEVGLESSSFELDEVSIQTTRTNQNLRDIPTRIEALPLEELDEKSIMRPGDIKMLLGEVTGIRVQQTSAVSGNSNFRIQGLDSRYTQLLQDGMPLYSGLSGNLSLLQISPLDLKQVEFIKGSASTLYGGGAIAGLINLISKIPQKVPEFTLILNGTSAKGADASAFYSRKWKHVGTTIFGSYNYNDAYDPSSIGLSAIPKTKRFTINPKVFLYIDEKNFGWFGVNTTYENRYGGDMNVIAGKTDNIHQYFERNKTFRFSTKLSYTHKVDQENSINFKTTLGYFDRELGEPGFDFKGKQLSSFTELNYLRNGKRNNLVVGANFIKDHFTAKPPQNNLDQNITTIGAFIQNTYRATEWFSLESGLRLDKNTPASNGLFLLPRVNALFKLNNHFTSRVGGGLGYKTPTLSNDKSDQDGYQNIKPLNIGNIKAEQSYGVNGDLNFRSSLADDAFININQLFFYSYVDKPLILQDNEFFNAFGYLTTKGAETNVKLVMDELVFYLGYTYTNTKQNFNGQLSTQPLTPKSRFSLDVTYEIEKSFRFGAESFYTSSQSLSDGSIGQRYMTFGLLVQKMWKHFDLFLNAENLTDRKQTRWNSIYTGSITNPNFKDIYAPLEGVVVNGGIRVKVF